MRAMPMEGSRHDLFGVIAGLVPAIPSHRLRRCNVVIKVTPGANEIARDADIERAAGAACKNVYIELSHAPSVQNRDGRDKPGHDDA
jgi:hypothetical protein